MPNARKVKIGHQRVFLLLSDEHEGQSTRSSKGELWSVHVHLHLPYRADAQVHLSAAVDTPLAPFFEELAAEWKGWESARQWRVYEDNFGLACTNDGRGHVTVTVDLDMHMSTYRWLVRGDVPLDAGQLDQVARDIRGFEQT